MSTPVVPFASPAKPSPPSISPQPVRRNAWRQLTLRAHRVRTRFTLAKLRQLLLYARTTSWPRQLAMVVLFPVPSILASFVVPLIPLNDPRLGFAKNLTFLLQLFATCMFTLVGTMLQVRAAAAIPESQYTNTDVLLVAVASSAPMLALATVVATYWRFPIPFFWVLFVMPWLVCLIFGNALVLRNRLATLGPPLVAYIPSLAVQVGQLVVYPVYTALFEVATRDVKIALIVCFPLLKIALKKGIFALTRTSKLSTEIAVSAVEISSSMYQCTIMQTTPSLLATALVIGIDVLQGLVAVRHFWRQGAALSHTSGMASIAPLVDATHASTVDDETELSRYASRVRSFWPSTMVGNARRVSAAEVAVVAPQASHPLNASDRVREKLLLTQTLELLQTAETILLVEYIEVAVPLVNAAYVAFATRFDTAIYSPKLRPLHDDPLELRAAMANLVLYTVLQTLTLVAMAVALQYRLKLSALTVLAFVLDNHFWSLQGKMVAWLSVFFVFSIAHNGVDFTFKFDFIVR